MKTLTFWLLFFQFFSVHAYAIEFFKKDENWFISAADCATLENIVREISVWAGKVDNELKSAPACLKTKDSYEMNLTKVVPTKVAEILKKGSTQKNGHNCWNFSLFSQGLTNSLRYTGETEFKRTLEDVGVCKKLDPQITPMPGDIVALRVENNGVISELHTYVYLADNIMMHKRGSLPDHSYELSYASEIDSNYQKGIESSCESCSLKKDLYRCDSQKRDDLYTKNVPARDSLIEVECLQKNILDQSMRDQFLTKSNALKRLTNESLENLLSKYMDNKDQAKEKEITEEIEAWLHIKLQLDSINAHH